MANAAIQINESQLAKRHYLSNRFDSFNIDDLNWTVWIRIDWYVEVDFEKAFHGSFTLYSFFTKTNYFSRDSKRGETILTSWSITKSIFKYPIFRDTMIGIDFGGVKKCGKWNRSEFSSLVVCPASRERWKLFFMQFARRLKVKEKLRVILVCQSNKKKRGESWKGAQTVNEATSL
jgi:hypothetical protein